MRLTSRLPLRWRITLMTGIVVLVSNLCMMMVSIYYANNSFDVVMTNVSYYYENSIDDYGEATVMNDAFDDATEKKQETDAQASPAAALEEVEEFHFDAIQENLEDLHQSELTDADAASASVYFPDNSSVSKSFNLISVITMFVTTFMGMVIAYVLSARALRPIQQLNQSVLMITDNNLNRRVEESGVNDEVGSLQKSFNGMMDRLETSFNRQKEFSRNVAHELKTPLTTMKAGIQVLNLDEHPSRKEVEHVLNVTEKNIDRLISIVQDLLLFTKEEHVEFNDEIEVRTLLMQILEENKELAEKQKVTLHLECDENCKVIQNEALLARALNNLVENAIKYNRQLGRVDLRVIKTNHHLRIEIEDTGIGISQQQLDRIWDPFYCADESRSRLFGGAGIGLALVRSIAEKCGFEVYVSSEKDKGSLFTVEISNKL